MPPHDDFTLENSPFNTTEVGGEMNNPAGEFGSENWSAFLPVWSVGDLWTYDAELDGQEMVEGSADLAGAELDLLRGDATLIIDGVEEIDVGGQLTPVYRTITTADVVGDGRDFPAPILGTVDGYLTAEMTLTEYLRVGDLALIKYDKQLVMRFTAVVALIEQTVDVADFVESGVYSPPLESYDFPLTESESWNLVTNLTKTYSGSSDVVTLPEEPEYFDQEWLYLTNETGYGGFSGCENSTRVWQTHIDGTPEDWRWWCPEINQYSHRWTNDIALGGVNATLIVNGYQPTSGNVKINLSISPKSSPLNGEIDCTILVTQNGEPLASKSGYLYFHGVDRIRFETDINGTSIIRLMVGNTMDDTPTSRDWATSGVTAYLHSDQSVGATTLTLEGSAIGGLLRIEAKVFATQTSTIMLDVNSIFETSIRY